MPEMSVSSVAAPCESPPETAVANPSPPSLLQRHSLLTSLALVASVFAVVLAAFTPRYLTNDDAVMNLIASGSALTDAPDEHLIFTNILIGWALKALYQAAPGVAWYGGYLLATALISLVAVVYVFLRANPARVQMALIALFLAAFAFPILRSPQFTLVAFSAGMAGMLLILAGGAGIAGTGAFLLGPALLVLGWLVRYESCILSGIVFAPAVAVGFLYPARPKLRWAIGLALATSAAGMGSVHALNAYWYATTPGWEGFYELNHLQCRVFLGTSELIPRTDKRQQRPERRRLVQDGQTGQHGQHRENAPTPSHDRIFSVKPPLARVLNAVGWSDTDLEMFRKWSFADQKRFSAEKYQILLQAINEGGVRDRSWQALFKVLAVDRRLLILLISGIACCLVAGGGWLRRAGPFAALVIAAALSIALYFQHHLPERVYLAAFSAFPATALALAAPGPRGWRDLDVLRRWSVLGAGALAVILLGLNAAAERRREAARRISPAEARQMLAELDPRPDHLYIFWGADFPYEDVVFPGQACSLPAQLKAATFSWATRTPLHDQRLEQFGITDIYRAVYERDDVRLVCRPENAALLCAYLKEHYGVEARVEEVFAHRALRFARVFRIRRAVD